MLCYIAMLCYSKERTRIPDLAHTIRVSSKILLPFHFHEAHTATMKISIGALLLPPAALARGGSAVAPIADPTATISARLLEKAVPLQEYQKQNPNDESLQRQLANNDNNNYYATSNSYDFASYSLKYTTCQRIQHYSSDAIANGESSPLVTTDVVLLRMCPERRCGDNSEMGCSVGWADYVLNLDEYVRIMTNYELDKQRNLCGLCEACQKGYGDFYYSGYRYNNGGQQRSRHLEDGADAGDDDAAADDAVAAYDDDYTEGGTCYANSALCHINEETCANLDAGGEENENGYATLSDYLNYLGCVEVKDGMYINARCDSESNKIGWGVFSDPYCTQYAGDGININAVVDEDIIFEADAFEAFYGGQCIPCSSGSGAPYFNSNNNMCNKMYEQSDRCNAYIAYDFSDNDADEGDGNICSFIRSIRNGAFNKEGLFGVKSSGDGPVTRSQIVTLVCIGVICTLMAVYSCWLHHEMTNILLKSLAQKNLMDEVARKAIKDREELSKSNKSGVHRSSVLGRWARKKKKSRVVAPTHSTDSGEDESESSESS